MEHRSNLSIHSFFFNSSLGISNFNEFVFTASLILDSQLLENLFNIHFRSIVGVSNFCFFLLGSSEIQSVNSVHSAISFFFTYE